MTLKTLMGREVNIVSQPILPPDKDNVALISEKKYFYKLPLFYVIIGVLLSSLVYFSMSFFSSKTELDNKNLDNQTPQPTVVQEEQTQTEMDQVTTPQPLFPEDDTPLPTFTPVPSKKTDPKGSLSLTISSKHTTEPVNQFIGVLVGQNAPGNPVISFEGTGNQKVLSDIPEGTYRLRMMAGRDLNKYGCAYIPGYYEKEISIARNQNSKMEISLIPYAGVLHIKDDKSFPVPNAKVEVISSDASKVYFSTYTDSLGRAVVYTVNPKPHFIRITAFGQSLVKEFTGGDCLWLEKVILPFSGKSSSVEVIVNPKVRWESILTELVIKYFPLEIENPVPGSNTDFLGKYSLSASSCVGTYSITTGQHPATLSPSGQLYSKIENVPPGRYFACASEASIPGIYYESEWKEVLVSGEKDQTVEIVYPKNY